MTDLERPPVRPVDAEPMPPALRRPTEGLTTRDRLLSAVAVVLALIALAISGSPLIILRATEVAAFIVAFSGLHILSGRLGLISVGHGAFIGIGAVAAAHAIDDLSVPYLLAPLAGAAGAALFGVVIGVPSLRLPGSYLALLTLAVAMVLPIGLRQLDGPLGYRVEGDLIPPAWTGLAPGDDEIWQFALVLVVGAFIMAVVHGTVRGRFTRALVAVRDEPTAAAAFGLNVARIHLTGVAISAGLAGAAGGLILYASPLVAGEQYPFSLSVAMFALMVALGASKLWTSVPAALTVVLLPELLVRAGQAVWEPIVYGMVLLIMTRLSRGRGLVSLWEPKPNAIVSDRAGPPANKRPPGQPRPQHSGNPWLLTPEPPSTQS